jgi:hypothetical protein
MKKIQTYICSDVKPEPVLRDSRGVKIDLGLRVAFNKGGYVKIGKIISFDRNEFVQSRNNWWSLKFVLIIENEDSSKSTIRNPNSFIII